MNMKSSVGNGKMSRTIKLQILMSALQAINVGAGTLTDYFDPQVIILAMFVLTVVQSTLGAYLRTQTTGPLE